MKFSRLSFLKPVFINGGLLFTSIILSLLFVEFLLRLIFHTPDYLGTPMEPDDRLGHRIVPHASGHDDWGFRNESVPDRTDIVTIGDSQTYGASTPKKYNWPTQLSQKLNRTVYNLGLGGYGCVEYYSMLEQEAIKLRPKLVIVGLYLGNDILDGFDSVYYRDYWRSLRDSALVFDYDSLKASRVDFTAPKSPFGYIIRFLTYNSMLYRLSVYAFTENIWQRFLIRKIAAKSHDKVFLDDKNLDLLIGFSPRLREHGLNPDNIKVREGLRITLNRLHAMHTFCKEYGISFMVVLLPTKEKVYEPVINKHPDINFFSVFQRVFTFEDSIKHTIIKDLKKDSIHYIDVLPPLQNAIKKQQIYPITRDGHPNKNGCQIIAASAAKYCSKQFKEFQ